MRTGSMVKKRSMGKQKHVKKKNNYINNINIAGGP